MATDQVTNEMIMHQLYEYSMGSDTPFALRFMNPGTHVEMEMFEPDTIIEMYIRDYLVSGGGGGGGDLIKRYVNFSIDDANMCFVRPLVKEGYRISTIYLSKNWAWEMLYLVKEVLDYDNRPHFEMEGGGACFDIFLKLFKRLWPDTDAIDSAVVVYR